MFTVSLDKILELFFSSLDDDDLVDFRDTLDKWADYADSELEDLGDYEDDEDE